MRRKGCWVGDGKIRFALLFLSEKPSDIGAFDYRHIPQTHHRFPVGASLLAKAACQSTHSLNDLSHSRAGSLPRWISTGFEKEQKKTARLR
jgi:hypothetical protein